MSGGGFLFWEDLGVNLLLTSFASGLLGHDGTVHLGTEPIPRHKPMMLRDLELSFCMMIRRLYILYSTLC